MTKTIKVAIQSIEEGNTTKKNFPHIRLSISSSRELFLVAKMEQDDEIDNLADLQVTDFSLIYRMKSHPSNLNRMQLMRMEMTKIPLP